MENDGKSDHCGRGGSNTANESGGTSLSVKPTARPGNLRWILGVSGGAIAGLCMGASLHGPEPKHVVLFSLLLFSYVVIGTIIGGLLPRVGCLAGLGAIVALVVGSVALAHSASLKYSAPGRSEDYIRHFFLLFPLTGSGIGIVWSIVARAWRRTHHEQASPLDKEAAAAVRQDRIRLAQASLGAGVVVGLGFGILIGGPFIIAGPILGAIAGGTVFVLLAVSAYISSIFK